MDSTVVRCGGIGPVRREIVFEPLPERPAPEPTREPAPPNPRVPQPA